VKTQILEKLQLQLQQVYLFYRYVSYCFRD